ncbi:MAG: hypothetical protein F6K39_10835 [Okeania sp. SIO3B3]|nr:hypothetical protein [Okeania sp. SIO3B3]
MFEIFHKLRVIMAVAIYFSPISQDYRHSRRNKEEQRRKSLTLSEF